MSLYTLFEILAYLVAATLLGFGIGRVSRTARPLEVSDDDIVATTDTAEIERLRDELTAAEAALDEQKSALDAQKAAQAELAEQSVEVDALVSEVAALKRTSMTQRFLPDGPVDPDVEGSPAGTLDSWPPPDEVELDDPDEVSRATSNQLQIMVSHLRTKMFEATREARRAVEEREAMSVELKSARKVRDAQLDEEARWQVEIAEREAEVEAMRDRLAAAAREIDDDAEQVSRLDERLATALAQVEDLEGEVRRIGDERDSAQEWGETLEAEMASVQRKVDAWETRRMELEQAFETFRSPLPSDFSQDDEDASAQA